ncbi:MAG TPA: hypothetical protein VHH09_02440 [Acidimicrobiales bacterium]|nr:hypothetical protein [Acidimicrobiales bacterium]
MGDARAVVCRPDGTCLAVGGGVVLFNAAGLLGPLKTVPGAGRFTGLACLRAGNCIAVGESASGGPVVVELAADGTPGAVRPVPGAFQLYDLACPSSTTCIATGTRRTDIPTYPYSAWTPIYTVITNGQPGPVQRFPRGLSLITGIACPTATRCLAVGESGIAVLTRTDGSWTATPASGRTPDGSAGVGWAINCPSPAGCYAAGWTRANDIAVSAMLAVSPNGVLGAVQPLHDRWGSLYGISCLADGTCRMVGGDNATSQGLLVEAKPGSPPVATVWGNSNYFSDVSCLPTIGCGIVGNKPQQAVFGWKS